MNQKIDGNQRIFSVLTNDQYQNPEKILPYLRAEIREVAKEYLNLNGDIIVRYKITENSLVFMVEVPASSVKGMFCL